MLHYHLHSIQYHIHYTLIIVDSRINFDSEILTLVLQFQGRIRARARALVGAMKCKVSAGALLKYYSNSSGSPHTMPCMSLVLYKSCWEETECTCSIHQVTSTAASFKLSPEQNCSNYVLYSCGGMHMFFVAMPNSSSSFWSLGCY